MKYFVLISLVVSSLLSAAPEKKQIIMGFNPAENVDAVEMNGKKFSEYFSKHTGLSVKTFVATDYTALIEALRSGQIDFAWLAPFSYVKAEEMADATVLLKSVRKGHAHFYSAIITRSDRPMKTIEDLKGKSIAWVDPSSTSGHIFPKANLIVKKQIDPDTFFGRQIFAGSHDALVLAVLNGTVDAGATFSNDDKGTDGAWTLFLKDPKDQAKIRPVYITEPITGDTLATTKKFTAAYPAIVEKTVALLKDMGNNEEGRGILKALYRIDSMVVAKSEDYKPVRDAAKVLKLNAE